MWLMSEYEAVTFIVIVALMVALTVVGGSGELSNRRADL
jgi:hypothetical protein